VAEWIALSRLEIEQARLLVLEAARLIAKYGAKAARKEVGLTKVIVPRIQTAICNRALQIIDGPDEVHLRTIARLEVKEQAAKRPKV
jgi:acyl-CoA dehydrogenase